MRIFSLVLLLAAAAGGAAHAQVLGADPLLTSPSGVLRSDPLLQHHLQVEIQRLEADQRSAAAAQFRMQGEFASQQVQSTVRNAVTVGPSPDESAPYRVQGTTPAQARERAETLRRQRVERALQAIRTPSRR